MQAAFGQYATHSSHNSVIVQTASAGFPNSVRYAAATLELYSRLWQTLKDLSAAIARPDSGVDTERRLMALRVELALLLDMFDGPRSPALLRTEQRDALRTMVQWLLETLSLRPAAGLEAGIADAQDRLFDAALASAHELQNREGRNDYSTVTLLAKFPR